MQQTSLGDNGQLVSPTTIRYQVVGWATIMSLLLYLDRFCISICTNYIRQDLNVSPIVVGRLSSAFFFAYALCQVPSGWLTDRFGVRLMLSIFILAWSACTGLQAFAQSFLLLALLQLMCGMAQAGAYPAGARLVRDWNPPTTRGFGSAMVALGGRIGGALAPILTATMLVMFVPVSMDSSVANFTYLNTDAIVKRLVPPQSGSHAARLEYIWTRLDEQARDEILNMTRSDKPVGGAAQSAANTARIVTIADQHLGGILNSLIQDDYFYRADLFDLVIEREGQKLSRKLTETGQLTDDEHRRLNRLALEATFQRDLGNVYVSGWRPSMLVYGVIGVVIAALFWWQVRDTPLEDPRCNTAERELIQIGDAPVSRAEKSPRELFPWFEMLTDIALWGNCLLQITTNIGWVFLVRTMPQYLEEVHNVPLVTRGLMTSVPIWAGVIGVFFGGRLTDWLGQKFGVKWGRRLPLLVTRFTAAMGYGICIALSLFVPKDDAPLWMPWVYVAALSLVAVSVDIGVPSVWAYMQDVGGKHTAAVLGWGNMWGNLGAAAATEIYARILGKSAGMFEWNLLFAVLAGVFMLGAVGAMLMDSSKPLVAERREST